MIINKIAVVLLVAFFASFFLNIAFQFGKYQGRLEAQHAPQILNR
jgi:hypothetical protein